MGLKHFFELELSGGLIRADGKIIAFSYGSPVSGRVFDVHVEKALYDVNGAYNIINREFARRFCGDYQWINREDDAADKGLRTSKLQYGPARLAPKYRFDPQNELLNHVQAIPELKTERLTLSALTEADIPAYNAWCWTPTGTAGGAMTMWAPGRPGGGAELLRRGETGF